MLTETTSKKITALYEKLKETLLAKNTDYGDSAFEPPMMFPELEAGAAIRVRMSDKLKRIIKLETGPAKVKAEPLADSYLDLAGYAILRIAELEKFSKKE